MLPSALKIWFLKLTLVDLSFEASKIVGKYGYVLGADISKILLDLAKKNFSSIKNLEFKYCDVQNYNFKKNIFSKVISRFGVMFFENPIVAFKNIYNSILEMYFLLK